MDYFKLALLLVCFVGGATISLSQETVPDLKIIGGYLQGQSTALVSESSEFKGVEDLEITTGRAKAGVFWTRVSGDSKVFEALMTQGALPLQHDWSVMGAFSERRIPVVNVGSQRKAHPDWLPDYLRMLRSEIGNRGYFVSSALSTSAIPLENGALYRVRLIGNHGKVIIGQNGKPYIFAFRYRQ